MFQTPDMLEKLEWNNTFKEGYYRMELHTFLVIMIILCLILSLIIYFNFQHKELSERVLLIKLCIILVIGILVCLAFLFELIKVWISVDSTNSNFIWTILISILLGIYMSILGITNSMKNPNRIMLLIITIYLFLVGLGIFGFLIYIDMPFLLYKFYESNTIRGIYFLLSNLYILIIFYVVSFLTESEVS